MKEKKTVRATNFQQIKSLIQHGCTLDEFNKAITAIPLEQRADYITKNQSRRTATLLDILKDVPEVDVQKIMEKHFSAMQLQKISEAGEQEKSELILEFLDTQDNKITSFLVDVIGHVKDDKKTNILMTHSLPKRLVDSHLSIGEKTNLLHEYLAPLYKPDSFLMEALMNGRKDIFDYLVANGAKPEALIFDNYHAQALFDGQYVPYGESDEATQDPKKLAAYRMRPEFIGSYAILDSLNDQWTSQQKSESRLLNMAVFFGHTELVEKLLQDPEINPNLPGSRNRAALTNASANLDFRGEIYQLLLQHPRVMLDRTGVANYAFLTYTAVEFENFIKTTKGKISSVEFPPNAITTAFSNPKLSFQDASRKFELLFKNNLVDINLLKEQMEIFNALASNLPSPVQATIYAVVSRELVKGDELLQAIQVGKRKPAVWLGLVKQVSKDPELQKFLEASAGVSKDINELNKAVQTYNSRSIGKRIADGITGFFTRTNKQHVQDTNDLMTQIKETHTNAVSLGIPSLMVDKLVTDLHKANDGVEKDRALEQIRSNAELFKGSSFENLVQVAEQKIKDKRAPEIAKLMQGMDKIDLKLEKMDHKKKMFTIIAEGTLEAVAQIPKDQSKRGGRKLLKGAAESILKQLSQDGVLVNFNPEQKKLLKLEIQDIMQRRLEEPIPSTSLTTALEGLKKGEKLEEVAQQGLAKRVVAVCTHYTQLAEKNPPQVAKTRQPELQKKKFTQTVRESQAIPTSQTAVSA